MQRAFVLCALLAAGGALAQPRLDPRAPLGALENPVKAQMPAGQREYLRRLRCADGQPPKFERIGNLGMGPYGNIVDGYKLECAGAEPRPIVMDMYHVGYREAAPVPGFTIAP